MRWVRVIYIIDLSLFSRVISEHTIHNKSYYSPLSSERGWGRGFISPIPFPQQKGKVGHFHARPFVISMKEWFILVATSQR